MTQTNPLWYKDAIIYQVHVKAFKDSKGEGIGTFRGLTEKLDYLESLGITALWLLPFFPSPMKDDGYDIADYYTVNPQYGTMKDFQTLLAKAHQKNIRVIIELVINHTSDQHPWFQKSRRAKKSSPWRDFYVWNSSPAKYQDARVIFKDFEASNWTWDEKAQAYYWHRFYSHQPDLNFDHPPVHKEIFKAVDFWFELGVDGMRLDAIPYLYEREGTSCENLPETHAFLQKLRQHVDSKYPDKMLLAEANQWPEDAITYFGEGNECHMAFHFPLMPRLFMAIHMEDRFPIVDILEQTPAIPNNCQWAIFLRNHDELTLEMVTNEERDYMYSIYAKDPTARINLGIRRRLAPLMSDNRNKIELMNILLFSLPGTPVIYYGDEIGMGDNFYLGDRNGVRTPMQWTPGRNAGFSVTNPQKLYLPLIIDPEYHYESINVENQERNPSSLLWWMRQIIHVRKKYPAFSHGNLEFIPTDNSKVLVFTRTFEDQTILVVANLSRFSQAVEIDLAKYQGATPVELFHQSHFPLVKDTPYSITLGPYGYFWIAVKDLKKNLTIQSDSLPPLVVKAPWKNIFVAKSKTQLEKIYLPAYLQNCRWFSRKSQKISAIKIISSFHIENSYLLILETSYADDAIVDLFLLPVSFAEIVDNLNPDIQKNAIAELQVGNKKGFLYEALHDPSFHHGIFKFIVSSKHLKDTKGILYAESEKKYRAELKALQEPQHSKAVQGQQSNSSVIYGQKYFLKFFRKLEEGTNPEFEMTCFLKDRLPFISPCAGKIIWKPEPHTEVLVGMLLGYVPHQETGWDYFMDVLSKFYENVIAKRNDFDHKPESVNYKKLIEESIGGYISSAQTLGIRTAELHLALSSDKNHPAFAPIALNSAQQRPLYQTLRVAAKKTLIHLRKLLPSFSPAVAAAAKEVVNQEETILNFIKKVFAKGYHGQAIRVHGDYHLGQILFTGKDFYIIDFEGEPGRSLQTRSSKNSPLVDVTGMMHSFHYAAYKNLYSTTLINPEMAPEFEVWAESWTKAMSDHFFKAYLEKLIEAKSDLIQGSSEDIAPFMTALMLQKTIHEIDYDLNHRPDWVLVPLKLLNSLLKGIPTS